MLASRYLNFTSSTTPRSISHLHSGHLTSILDIPVVVRITVASARACAWLEFARGDFLHDKSSCDTSSFVLAVCLERGTESQQLELGKPARGLGYGGVSIDIWVKGQRRRGSLV